MGGREKQVNTVLLIGRLTKDPEVRYTTGNQMAVARFSVAIDRGKDKNGESRGADFPNVIVFGKTAENCEKYLSKGSQVGIQGRIQTGSYTNKEGQKVYTTDVVAERVEFLGTKQDKKDKPSYDDIPDGFTAYEDDGEIPF